MKNCPHADMQSLDSIVDKLCTEKSLASVYFAPKQMVPMPSVAKLTTLMERLQAAIYPGFFDITPIRPASIRYHLAANLDSIYHILAEQIRCGSCFAYTDLNHYQDCYADAQKTAMAFMQELPHIRQLLVRDANAAYEGDPAATSPAETIFCYPSMLAMTHHRIAHTLYNLKVPVIPRIVSEMAHAKTGIDIHPGATIGEDFFIDHGTGVVIGETAIIGKNCRIYQGVTLGALSFPKESDGTLTKGIARHPILEDNVTVYAGATILGRVTIGSNAIIGGNVWLTKDVPAHARVIQEHATQATL